VSRAALRVNSAIASETKAPASYVPSTFSLPCCVQAAQSEQWPHPRTRGHAPHPQYCPQSAPLGHRSRPKPWVKTGVDGLTTGRDTPSWEHMHARPPPAETTQQTVPGMAVYASSRYAHL
jgi:hypothetical protein